MELIERLMGKDNFMISRILLGAIGAPIAPILAVTFTEKRNESWKSAIRGLLSLPVGYLYSWKLNI